MSKLLYRILLAVFIGIALIACTKVTQENFDKIHNDMTIKEIVAILGEPTSSNSVDFMGLSGTSSTWKDKNAEINIIFFNNKVQFKSFSKEGSTKTEVDLRLPTLQNTNQDTNH